MRLECGTIAYEKEVPIQYKHNDCVMANKKPVIAICYDFDGTLSPGNMQEYGFFSGLGSSAAKKFWCDSERKAKENHADPILAYTVIKGRYLFH